MEILAPGLLSTIQDLGRFGFQASGFAPSGAADSLSMKRANALVGNAPEEPDRSGGCSGAFGHARRDGMLSGGVRRL